MAYSYDILKERLEEYKAKYNDLNREKNKEIAEQNKKIRRLKNKIADLNQELIDKQKELKESNIMVGLLAERVNWKNITKN